MEGRLRVRHACGKTDLATIQLSRAGAHRRTDPRGEEACEGKSRNDDCGAQADASLQRGAGGGVDGRGGKRPDRGVTKRRLTLPMRLIHPARRRDAAANGLGFIADLVRGDFLHYTPVPLPSHLCSFSQLSSTLLPPVPNNYPESELSFIMQAANRFQKALKKGGATFGAWQVNIYRLSS